MEITFIVEGKGDALTLVLDKKTALALVAEIATQLESSDEVVVTRVGHIEEEE